MLVGGHDGRGRYRMEAMTMGERRRIIHLYNQGWNTKRIAEAIQRSVSGVRRIRQQHRERGTLEPRQRGHGPPPKVSAQDRQHLAELVRQHPDATLDELLELSGLPVCRSTLDLHLRRLRISFKKKSFTRQSRIAPMLPGDERSGV